MRKLLEYLFMLIWLVALYYFTIAYLEIFGFNWTVIPSVIVMIIGGRIVVKWMFWCPPEDQICDDDD